MDLGFWAFGFWCASSLPRYFSCLRVLRLRVLIPLGPRVLGPQGQALYLCDLRPWVLGVPSPGWQSTLVRFQGIRPWQIARWDQGPLCNLTWPPWPFCCASQVLLFVLGFWDYKFWYLSDLGFWVFGFWCASSLPRYSSCLRVLRLRVLIPLGPRVLGPQVQTLYLRVLIPLGPRVLGPQVQTLYLGGLRPWVLDVSRPARQSILVRFQGIHPRQIAGRDQGSLSNLPWPPWLFYCTSQVLLFVLGF